MRILKSVGGIAVGCLILAACNVEATPQFSVLTGNRCINCHVTNQGSGLRSDLGKYSMDGVGMLNPKALKELSEALASASGGPVTLGFDFRAQTVRSHVSPLADRRAFPMQAAVYAAREATGWLTIEGTYNFGPKKFDGQQRWSGSVILQPDFSWPQLRVGYFQPTIGVRYDDHTLMVRSTGVSSGSQSLIAPNYAEVGAELTYYRHLWLSLSGGVFGARSLAENSVDSGMGQLISLIADEDKPSVVGRVVLWPRAQQGRLNFYLGSSYLLNDDFWLLNAFAGFGVQDRLWAMVEYARSDKESMREGRNVSADVGVQVFDWLLPYVRGEQAQTRTFRTGGTTSEVTTNHLVAGLQLFLMPGVELRPEYRLLDTEVFRSGRYAVQLHVFH